jgi:hypothetical protein
MLVRVFRGFTSVMSVIIAILVGILIGVVAAVALITLLWGYAHVG